MQLEQLAALVREGHLSWSDLHLTPDEFIEACGAQDLIGLVYQRIHLLSDEAGWPQELRLALTHAVHTLAAAELLRKREIVKVLDALAAANVRPILFKGTPLAYTHYNNPSSRPRNDTDLLVPRHQVETLRREMARLGYSAPTYCDGELLFCQFEYQKTDEFGVVHAFDFHWKISTQPVFADLMTYDELAADAVPIPPLGGTANAVSPVQALLLACVHPVMHHRNVECLIWIYDIHLLASELSISELERFADLTIAKRVAAIVMSSLSLARSRFGTRIPERILDRLAATRSDEPSAVYLGPARRWHDELISSVGGLPHWRDRIRLLREVVFPSPDYMLKSYRIRSRAAGGALLPALYIHRVIYGLWKVTVGQK